MHAAKQGPDVLSAALEEVQSDPDMSGRHADLFDEFTSVLQVWHLRFMELRNCSGD